MRRALFNLSIDEARAPLTRPDLCSEDKAGANRGANHLVGHFGANHVVESLSGAMAGYQIIGIDVLEGCNDLPNVLVGQWGHDVESADNSMHLLDAGSRLCLLD